MVKSMKQAIIIVFATIWCFQNILASPPSNGEIDTFKEVNTECGLVQGKRFSEEILSKHTQDAKPANVYEFRNIPYAQAPVGALRWRPPVSLSNGDKSKCWKGTLKYEENKIVSCRQNFPFPLEETEDCLVLTVRTPSLKRNAKLPVMVWIHGGGMFVGNNEMPAYFPNTEFTADLDIVTVSINYRLGIFGFLSLKELWVNSGPDESYGNYGIMDQIEALKWVQRNIENFGGDPKNVAVFGESGGGTAVYCLLSSPLAQGLFQKAISASGSPRIRTTHLEADKKYRPLITQTNCQRSTSEETKRCLQELDGDKILKLFEGETVGPKTIYLGYKWEFPFNKPYKGFPIEIIDPVVVPSSPEKIQASSIKSPVEILIGNTAQEISQLPGGAFSPEVNITSYQKLRKDLNPKMESFQKGLYNKMLKSYFSELKCPVQRFSPRYMYQVMSTDAILICATNQAASHFSQLEGYKVSRFVLSQPPSKELETGLDSAYHSWDTSILFGLRQLNGTRRDVIPSQDRNLMFNFRNLYRSFMYSLPSMCLYLGRNTDFWAGSVLFTRDVDRYHKDQCKMWNEAGVLNHSWNDLGKP